MYCGQRALTLRAKLAAVACVYDRLLPPTTDRTCEVIDLPATSTSPGAQVHLLTDPATSSTGESLTPIELILALKQRSRFGRVFGVEEWRAAMLEKGWS
jgi:hypothetical protein